MSNPTTSERVREFHEAFGHPVKNDGADLSTEAVSDDVLSLRMNLIAEEFGELVGAVYGKQAEEYINNAWDALYSNHLDHRGDGERNRDVVETADALADLDYVISGFALVAGIPHDDVVEEVHRSNMSKLGEDGNPIYREDGKVLKGPHYFRPDVAKVLTGGKDS